MKCNKNRSGPSIVDMDREHRLAAAAQRKNEEPTERELEQLLPKINETIDKCVEFENLLVKNNNSCSSDYVKAIKTENGMLCNFIDQSTSPLYKNKIFYANIALAFAKVPKNVILLGQERDEEYTYIQNTLKEHKNYTNISPELKEYSKPFTKYLEAFPNNMVWDFDQNKHLFKISDKDTSGWIDKKDEIFCYASNQTCNSAAVFRIVKGEFLYRASTMEGRVDWEYKKYLRGLEKKKDT